MDISEMQDMPEIEKVPKKKKRKFKLRHIVLLGILVFGIYTLAILGYELYDIFFGDPPLTGLYVPTEEEWNEKLKTEQSDIQGMTRYDKKEMGLWWEDGSDTDGDGLTDKEEIEVYGSDPLKSSTAGDLYYDGYKVEHEMDLHTYYDYTDSIEFKNNGCSEVQLTATLPSDFSAVVRDYTNSYDYDMDILGWIVGWKIRNYIPEKIYELYGYQGEIELSANTNDDIDFTNIKRVLIVTNDEECKFTKPIRDADTGDIKIDCTFVKGSYYNVFLLKRKPIGRWISDLISGTLLTGGNTESSGDSLIVGSPLLNCFGIPAWVYYPENADLEMVQKNAKEAFDDGKIVAKQKSGVWINATYTFLEKYCSYFRLDVENATRIRYFFFVYCGEDVLDAYVKGDWKNDKSEKATENIAKEQRAEGDSGFSIAEDELPFGNFGSYISSGGNCAGISHLTAVLYNQKSFPNQGRYVSKDSETGEIAEAIQWDLTTDEENKTLFDPGLYDYKDAKFVENHIGKKGLLDKDLTDGELEFVRMIGAYWAMGNDSVSLGKYVLSEDKKYAYSIIDQVKEEIDSGKIVECYIFLNSGGGHAIDVYGYKQDKKESNVLWLKVYDCNFPQDRNSEIKKEGCRIKIERVADGEEEIFEYKYNPHKWLKGWARGYYTNSKNKNKTNVMLFLRDDWEPIH